MDYQTEPLFIFGLLVFGVAIIQSVRAMSESAKRAKDPKCPTPSRQDTIMFVAYATFLVIVAIGGSSIVIVATIIEATDKG